jgi:hypothetical protein
MPHETLSTDRSSPPLRGLTSENGTEGGASLFRAAGQLQGLCLLELLSNRGTVRHARYIGAILATLPHSHTVCV